MPVLTELNARLLADSGWQQGFDQAITAAQQSATGMPLIHVTEREGRFGLAGILLSPTNTIPLSDDGRYCGALTQEAERLLGISPCVYFYAGRADQQYGRAAFAFPPSIEDGRNVSVTPFDSGALVHPTEPLDVNLTAGGFSSVREFFDASCWGPDWRSRFGELLAAYFPAADSYWIAKPTYPDPDEIYVRNARYNAWTVEVRLSPSPSILSCVGWTYHEDFRNALLEMMDTPPLDISDPNSPLRELLTRSPAPPENRCSLSFAALLEGLVRTSSL